MYIRIGLLVGFASAVAWGTSAAVVGYYKPIVAELETRVKTANALAEAQNREIEIKNQLLLTRAKQYATDLDLAYEKSKKIIDVHRGQLDAISKRVLDHSGARCPSTRLSDTNGSSSGSAEDPAQTSPSFQKSLSDNLQRMLSEPTK